MENLLNLMSEGVKTVLAKTASKMAKEIEEIRMRAGKPLMVQNWNQDWFVGFDGELSVSNKCSYIVTQQEIMETLELMSENSIYAYLDEIINGFITLKGGHRVGIVGRVVMGANGVKNIKDISGLNIRISRQICGCSEKLIRHVIKSEKDVYNTLIVSPPQCGKTTMLRDIARVLGDGDENLGFKGIKVGIVDERSEIAACFKGIPQNNVGMRTDVLDCCPKSIGMMMMIRSMSPQVIITDEIGNEGDGRAVLKVLNAGVKIITSAHGYNVSELKSRYEVLTLINAGVFDRFIVLSGSQGPGTVEEIIDGQTMKRIC